MATRAARRSLLPYPGQEPALAHLRDHPLHFPIESARAVHMQISERIKTRRFIRSKDGRMAMRGGGQRRGDRMVAWT